MQNEVRFFLNYINKTFNNIDFLSIALFSIYAKLNINLTMNNMNDLLDNIQDKMNPDKYTFINKLKNNEKYLEKLRTLELSENKISILKNLLIEIFELNNYVLDFNLEYFEKLRMIIDYFLKINDDDSIFEFSVLNSFFMFRKKDNQILNTGSNVNSKICVFLVKKILNIINLHEVSFKKEIPNDTRCDHFLIDATSYCNSNVFSNRMTPIKRLSELYNRIIFPILNKYKKSGIIIISKSLFNSDYQDNVLTSPRKMREIFLNSGLKFILEEYIPHYATYDRFNLILVFEKGYASNILFKDAFINYKSTVDFCRERSIERIDIIDDYEKNSPVSISKFESFDTLNNICDIEQYLNNQKNEIVKKEISKIELNHKKFSEDTWINIKRISLKGLDYLKEYYKNDIEKYGNSFVIQNLNDPEEVKAKTRYVDYICAKGITRYKVHVIAENKDKYRDGRIVPLSFEFKDSIEKNQVAIIRVIINNYAAPIESLNYDGMHDLDIRSGKINYCIEKNTNKIKPKFCI